MFVKFTEHNDWEGESWSFFIPTNGNEEAIEDLRKCLAHMDDFELDEDETDEDEVDLLVKNSDTGYMDEYQKLSGELVLGDLVGSELADALYKGGIRNLML